MCSEVEIITSTSDGDMHLFLFHKLCTSRIISCNPLASDKLPVWSLCDSLEPSYFLWLQSSFKHFHGQAFLQLSLAFLNFKIAKISYFWWVFLVRMNTHALFYLRKMFYLVIKVGLVIVLQAAHFLIAVRYGGQHVFRCGTADCSSYNGLRCCFVFPFSINSLEIEIFEIFSSGEENCPLSPGLYWSLPRRAEDPLPLFLILQSK